MVSLLRFTLTNLIIKTLWLSLLATFGIHLLFSTISPSVTTDSAREKPAQASIEERWDTQKYVSWAYSILTMAPDISDTSSAGWLKKEFRLRAWNTFFLSGVAFIVSAMMGIFIGAFKSQISNELITRSKSRYPAVVLYVLQLFLFISSSVPAYIIAFFLFFLFSSESNAFLAIIALALGSGMSMDLLRLTVNTHTKQLSAKYVENALTCGLKTGGVIPQPGFVSWHAFRNSLITILPVTAYKLPLLLSAELVVEIVFDIPGLGEFLLTALINQNVPMVLTIVLFSVVFVQFCSFIAQFLSFVLHPQ